MDPEKKRVAVVGSRSFDDRARLYDVLTKNREKIKLIVSGGAKGADSLAVSWANDYGVPYLVFPPLWHDPDTGEYIRGAGFKRNVKIVEHSDVVIAFWDGESKGTAHTIEVAKRLNKPVKIISFIVEPPPEPKRVDLRTGKVIEEQRPPPENIPASLITLEEWKATRDGLCCSTPTCIHQEPPPHIQQALLEEEHAKEYAAAMEFYAAQVEPPQFPVPETVRPPEPEKPKWSEADTL